MHKEEIAHWDGFQWSFVATPQPGVWRDLRAVAALSPQAAWAAGSYSTSGSEEPSDDQKSALIERFRGCGS